MGVKILSLKSVKAFENRHWPSVMIPFASFMYWCKGTFFTEISLKGIKLAISNQASLLSAVETWTQDVDV